MHSVPHKTCFYAAFSIAVSSFLLKLSLSLKISFASFINLGITSGSYIKTMFFKQNPVAPSFSVKYAIADCSECPVCNVVYAVQSWSWLIVYEC